MAVASILVGIVSGIVGLVVALLSGQGLLAALGLYALAGMLGMMGTIAAGLAARAVPAHVRLDVSSSQA